MQRSGVKVQRSGVKVHTMASHLSPNKSVCDTTTGVRKKPRVEPPMKPQLRCALRRVSISVGTEVLPKRGPGERNFPPNPTPAMYSRQICTILSTTNNHGEREW